MKTLIVAGIAESMPKGHFDKIIGVDRGALGLLEEGYNIDIAIGDFDSVDKHELRDIEEEAQEVIKLESDKDETDLEVALLLAVERFPDSEFVIAGGLGGRVDHFLTNIYLPTTEKIKASAENITFIDEQNIIQYRSAGTHIINQQPRHRYIGFHQVDTGNSLTITGAKYPLIKENNSKQTYTSNEFVSNTMEITFDKGMVIVIYSDDV